MPKNDSPHALRLYDSVAKHGGGEAAERIANQNPLSKSASIQKRFAWAQGVCAELEGALPEPMVKAIRMDCACGPDAGRIAKLKKLWDACADLDDFAQKATAQNAGFTIEHSHGTLILSYPQCYCSCVKRVAQPLSKTWCYCTLGYARRMFGHVLGREVGAELIQSVKTGAPSCKIRITTL